MTGAWFGIASMIPVMIGPLPDAESPALVAQLCNGGTITIPLGPEDDVPADPCRIDACHAGNCRKKLI